MLITEIDFTLIESKAENKLFRLTNDDGSVYDMTGSTVVCQFHKTDTPITISCTVNVVAGTIIVPFTTTHTDTLGNYEYIIEETKVSTEVIPLVKGNVTIIEYIPFSETIEAYLRSELPSNLTLTLDYQNQRITYWRRTLQIAFNISDDDLGIESAWPVLVNALLAKLVVHDALLLASKGSFIQFMGGSYQSGSTLTGGGALKSVETGPAKVEYYDSAASAKAAFTSSTGGSSFFDTLLSDICGLANQLKVKLYMCKGNIIPIAPQYHKNPNWEYETLTDPADTI